MADFGGSELDAFRAEARDWLEANYPQVAARRPRGRPADHDGRRQARPATTCSGSSGWPRRAGARRPGRRSTARGGLTPAEARVLQQEMDRIGAYNPMVGMGLSMFGPTLLEYGTEAQKQRHIPPIVKRRAALVPGLLRAGRRLRPRKPADQVRGRRRPLEDQRPEDLDERRAVRRLVLLPGAHRHHEEARRHQLRADRHASARRRDAADQADRRLLAVLRDLLHRRAGREGRHGRAAERRLDGGQAPAAARALGPGRRADDGRRRPAPSEAGQEVRRASTRRAASPTPTCASGSPRNQMDAKAHALTIAAGRCDEAKGNVNPRPPPR